MFAASEALSEVYINQLKFWSEGYATKSFVGGSSFSSTVQLEPPSRIIGFKASFGVRIYLNSIDQWITRLRSI